MSDNFIFLLQLIAFVVTWGVLFVITYHIDKILLNIIKFFKK